MPHKQNKGCPHQKQTAKWVCNSCGVVANDMQPLAHKALTPPVEEWEEEFDQKFTSLFGYGGEDLVKYFIYSLLAKEREGAFAEGVASTVYRGMEADTEKIKSEAYQRGREAAFKKMLEMMSKFDQDAGHSTERYKLVNAFRTNITNLLNKHE